MIDLDSATDDEINEAVSLLNGYTFDIDGTVVKNSSGLKIANAPMPDYCNSPADTWPIIFENRITTGWSGGDIWRATASNQGKAGEFKYFDALDENPLRAAMIVYLKMMEAEA